MPGRSASCTSARSGIPGLLDPRLGLSVMRASKSPAIPSMKQVVFDFAPFRGPGVAAAGMEPALTAVVRPGAECFDGGEADRGAGAVGGSGKADGTDGRYQQPERQRCCGHGAGSHPKLHVGRIALPRLDPRK